MKKYEEKIKTMKYDENKKESLMRDSNEDPLSSRARNRTVMLSPEITGQVRSLLQSPQQSLPISTNSIAKGNNPSDGFVSPETVLDSADFRNDTLVYEKKTTSLSTPETFVNPGSLALNKPSFSVSLRNEKPNGVPLVDKFDLEKFKPDSKLERPKSDISRDIRKSDTPTLTSQRMGTQNLRKPILKNNNNRHATFDEEREILTEDTLKRKVAAAKIIGFLVSFDSYEGGEIHEVRVGRWLVSSKRVNEDGLLLIEDESISALHAVIKVLPTGEVHILDQLSEYGTGIMKQGSPHEEDASGGTVKLSHGDVVRFGKRYFVFCSVPRIQITE